MLILSKKEEKTQHLRASSSSLYKYTTFFGEIQIALTFRNNPRNVKMQRFAAARGPEVLYYEALQRIYYSKRSVCSFAFTATMSTTSP